MTFASRPAKIASVLLRFLLESRMPREKSDNPAPLTAATDAPGTSPPELSDQQWDALIQRLTRHARQALWHVRKGTGDYNDAVVSALRTYLRQQNVHLSPPSNDPDDIWPLLSAHLKRKIDKLRHQQRYASNNFVRDGDLAATERPETTTAGLQDWRTSPTTWNDTFMTRSVRLRI